VIIQSLHYETLLLHTEKDWDKPKLYIINESELFVKDQPLKKRAARMMNQMLKKTRQTDQNKSHVERYLLEP